MKARSMSSILPPIAVHLNTPAKRSSRPTSGHTYKIGEDTADSSLWSSFWREFCLENEPHERCHIPGDGQSAVDRHWAGLADSLSPNARVLDLGCGAGILGRLLLARRKDLKVTGIDFANVPVTPFANLAIHPGVSMEALPFADGSFDAAISLFGVEYGSAEKTIRELGRVLLPGARFSFLIHHHESEIACEGSIRRKGLRELLSGKTRAAFAAGNVSALDQRLQAVKANFPNELSVRQFSAYLRRNLPKTRAQRQAIWQDMLEGLGPEIAILGLLERSAKSPSQMGVWLGQLLNGMAVVRVSILKRGSGQPIAWQVDGLR